MLEKSKYERIEKEYELMQKEMSSKEVLNKGLQRDIRRVTGSLDKITEDNQKLEIELESCEQQLSKMLLQHEADIIKIKKENTI